MIKVTLANFDNCPMWWKNFVNAQREYSRELDYTHNMLELIDQELEKNDIVRNICGGYNTLIFNDDAKYTWFIMRWS